MKLVVKVKQFLERRIEEPVKFIYIDATYFKVREDSRYRNKALYICIGINSEGKREILSSRLYAPESTINRELFFDDLKNRGLKGLKMVI